MTPDWVVQCDYCGAYCDVAAAVACYVPHHELADGRVQVVVAGYCSRYCGDRAAAAAVSLTRG